MEEEYQATVTYNERLERLIADEGERLQGMAWMHEQSNNYFCKLNTYLALPIIILSTLSGTISASSTTLFFDQKSASVCIGGVSIFVGVLSTLQSYFAYARRAENHRLSGISCIKLNHFITIEMALPRKERMNARDMLKIVRENMGRLFETAPPIPEHVIRNFQNKFMNKYPNIAIPDIANGLRSIVLVPFETYSTSVNPEPDQKSTRKNKVASRQLPEDASKRHELVYASHTEILDAPELPPSPKHEYFLDVSASKT